MTSALTTTSSDDNAPNDCDCFLPALVQVFLHHKGYSLERISATVDKTSKHHPSNCPCKQSFIKNLVIAIGVQLNRDSEMHASHFSKFGNVFDATFPGVKFRLYLCGVFGVDPKSLNSSPTSRTHMALTGAQLFAFLAVLCSLSEKIMSNFPSKPLQEKEDVIVACVHTADHFKNHLLIPDWLAQHGGWSALAKVADKIAEDDTSGSSNHWLDRFRSALPGAVVVASGAAALAGMVIVRR